MIRHSYTLEDIFTYKSMMMSLHDCKLGKMKKDDVVLFDAYSDQYIFDILNRIYNGTFWFSDLKHTYINERGKTRLLCSLYFQDRLVQKTINQNFLLPAIRPSLVYDNVASLKDRGMDQAINRVRCFLEKSYRHWKNDFYILKFDVKNYFDTISHDYCRFLIYEHTQDQRVLKLFDKIFAKYKYDNFIHGGAYDDFGIGLGGEIPQTFGIITLDRIDHIIKEVLKIPYSIRYMDDCILISDSKEYLLYCLDVIRYELSKINLALNQNKTNIVHISQGIKFLKFHFYLSNTGSVFITPYKKSIKIERRKLRSMKDLFDNNIISFSDVEMSYNSWRGHIMRANSYEILNHMDQIFNYLFIDN